MAFSKPQLPSWLLMAAAIAGAAVAGWLTAEGHYLAAAAAALTALVFATIQLNVLRRTLRRLQFVVEAAANNDFAYKFPTEGLSEAEADINASLTRLVEHLGALAEDARQREQYFSLVINLVDTGIAIADPQGHIIRSNTAALRLLERAALTHVSQLQAIPPTMRRTSTAATLAGAPVTIHTFSDIRRPLQNVEVETGERLIRVLTHEIMNSLTPMISLAQSMHAHKDSDEALSAIVQSGQALMDFVRNFRRYTLMPAPEPTLFFVKGALDQAMALAAKLDNAAGIRFRLDVMPPEMQLYTDRSLLHQVLMNILKNAVEAGATTVGIRADITPTEGVRITIANDGHPVPPEHASQIFTPFFTTRPGGSGIGLSFSRRIINSLGGTLELKATNPATFVITL